MSDIFEGTVVWVFPDHFDVDLIIGIQNVRENDIDKIVPFCMSAYEPDWNAKVKPGDIIVAGRNFGYGHAHPQAMATMRKTGVNVVLAESFAPGFFRAEIGNGMVLLTVPGITGFTRRFDRLSVDFDSGMIRNLSQDATITGLAPGPMARSLVKGKGYRQFLLDEIGKL